MLRRNCDLHSKIIYLIKPKSNVNAKCLDAEVSVIFQCSPGRNILSSFLQFVQTSVLSKQVMRVKGHAAFQKLSVVFYELVNK